MGVVVGRQLLSRAMLAVVGALCLTVATAASAAVPSPPLDSADFKVGADGELYNGGEFGDDAGFFASSHVCGRPRQCDTAGFASGSATLSGKIGNFTNDEFPVTARARAVSCCFLVLPGLVDSDSGGVFDWRGVSRGFGAAATHLGSWSVVQAPAGRRVVLVARHAATSWNRPVPVYQLQLQSQSSSCF